MMKPLEIHPPRPSMIPRRVSILSARDVLQRALVDMVLEGCSSRVLLRRILDLVVDLLDADRGTIFVFDEERQELVSAAAQLTEISRIRVPISHGVAGYVARACELINIPSCDTDSRFWRRVDERTGYHTQNMLTAPVQGGGRQCLGVVQLLNKRGGGPFTALDEETLTILVAQIAIILEQMPLLDLLEPPMDGTQSGEFEQVEAMSRELAPPPEPLNVDLDRRKDVFSLEPTLEELEARYISYLLAQHQGNRSLCARLMGVGRNTFHRKMAKYGIK